MLKRAALLFLLRAFLIYLTCGFSPALAISMDKSASPKECAVMFGKDAVEISGYQPDASDEKYCDAFPSAGKIIFVFDLTAPAMRYLPVEIRIIKDR